MDAALRCPCGAGLTFGECCRPVHAGERDAPTAESLMRSRFTAFAVGDETYLLSSWHPSSRPANVGIEPGIRWLRLDIVETVAGGPFDRDGVVEFVAHYRSSEGPGRLRERSRFVRDRAWLYVGGEVTEHGVQH
ncbi:YchJ family metal-binding protein [uncultured Agrococcus sp.]|uniref:YchJ family protein n=1 Tax=uncultured Agrococcus sp. TaxID=382258 RepID=UPI0025CC0E3C|nr:YchJ family metal-binding protein [uncultured Agrococcus sp.]